MGAYICVRPLGDGFAPRASDVDEVVAGDSDRLLICAFLTARGGGGGRRNGHPGQNVPGLLRVQQPVHHVQAASPLPGVRADFLPRLQPQPRRRQGARNKR